MTSEQNFCYMNDPRRIEAQKRLDDIVRRIQADTKSNGTALYYLTVLPQLLKELSSAYENLSVVEATVEAEVTGKLS